MANQPDEAPIIEGPIPLEVAFDKARVMFNDGRVIDFLRAPWANASERELAHAIATGSPKDVKIVGTANLGSAGAIMPPIPEPETP